MFSASAGTSFVLVLRLQVPLDSSSGALLSKPRTQIEISLSPVISGFPRWLSDEESIC